MSEQIQCDIGSGVASIVLADPASGNALDRSFVEQLHQALERSISDESCRTIVISARGPSYCQGLDLKAACAQSRPPELEFIQVFLDCLVMISRSKRPVLASIEGNVTGGGLGLVAACDVALAAEDVVFMLPEVVLGMIPALIAPFLLRRLTPARLKYLALSSRAISAREAKECGLIDEVATNGLENALNRQLQRLLRSSPQALAESKRYFELLKMNDLEAQVKTAYEELCWWLERPETGEGIRAFVDGQAPPWFQRHVASSESA